MVVVECIIEWDDPVPDDPVPVEVLDRVLGTALHAPSAGFSQGIDLLVLEGPAETGQFFEMTSDPEFLAGPGALQGLIRAPVIVLPLGDDRTVPENVGSQPLADVPVDPARLAGATVLAERSGAELFDRALDDWLVLTAGALAGMAERAVRIGVDYAAEREAFDQKIGAFQAVGHRLADVATASAGATLLAREAAWADDEEPGRRAELAAMAFSFAAEAARDATAVALHVHGGYGFMLEYDIQLYYRRARGWTNVLMSPSAAARRVADRRYGPEGAS